MTIAWPQKRDKRAANTTRHPGLLWPREQVALKKARAITLCTEYPASVELDEASALAIETLDPTAPPLEDEPLSGRLEPAVPLVCALEASTWTITQAGFAELAVPADVLFALRHLDPGPEDELATDLIARVARLHKAHGDRGRQPLDSATALAWIRALARAGALTKEGQSPIRQEDLFWHSGGASTAEAFQLTLATISRLRDRPRSAAPVLIPLYGSSHTLVPTSLGAVVSFARAHRQTPADDLELIPLTFCPERLVPRLVEAAGNCVILLSDYVWSEAENSAIARAAKAANPNVVIVRGGPQLPKYHEDVVALFDTAGDALDIAVHGEGEFTTRELVDYFATHTSELPDGSRAVALDPASLRAVAGISFSVDGLVTTAARERANDLSLLPSPFRDGTIPLEHNGQRVAIIETNRGCPYGCTFCDWGSSTLSRVRFRPEDEVFADLDFLCSHGVREVFIADANFGITERDVRVAQRLADLRNQYGVPEEVRFCYAKNTHKHLAEILTIFDQAKIECTRILSLQTTDPITLRNVKRSNIKLESYQRLAEEFRNHGWPVATELMVGLPGCTKQTAATDLQFCIDRAMLPTVARTFVLINSPMNSPEYRAAHQLVFDERKRIVSCDSFTAEELEAVMDLVNAYRTLEAAGVGRYLLRFGEDRLGRRMIDIVDDIDQAVRTEPAKWPVLAALLSIHAEYAAAWWDYDAAVLELNAMLRTWGVANDSALAAVTAAQAAVLPRPGRPTEAAVDLEHDVASWFRDHLASTADLPADRIPECERDLATYGPATLSVSPRSRTGGGVFAGALFQLELDTPMALAFSLGVPHGPRSSGD